MRVSKDTRSMATDPLSFREIGDPMAVGSKYGSIAGHETRVIYPEQKLTRGEFKPGRVLSWKWNSDGMAAWKPRDSRLFVEYRIAVGEVNETASDVSVGARAGAGIGPARPAPSLRMACLCNTALFDSGLRFIHNGVTIESVPNAYTVAMAMVLLNTNQEASDTAASNSLVTLRKSRGLPMAGVFNDRILGGDGTRAESDASSLQRIVPIPSVYQVTAGAGALAGDFHEVDSDTVLADAISLIRGDAAPADNDERGTALETLTLGELCDVLACRQSSAAVKDTNPNPKFEILNQSWNPADGIMTVQTAQPVMLSSWQHPYAWPGNNTFELHATISPHAMADIFVDTVGAYGCSVGNGMAISPSVFPGATERDIGQIYCHVESVELWASMVYPTVAPYVPRSISFKTNPFHLSSVLLTSNIINETVHVPSSTRACLLFSRSRNRHHVAVDAEELSTSFAGITTSVVQDTTAHDAARPNGYGRVLFDSPELHAANAQDISIDSRETVPANPAAGRAAADAKRQHGIRSLQLSLGVATWPRTQIAEQEAATSKMAMLWHYYLDYMNKGSFSRSSLPYSYSQFCGHFNSSFQSGPGLGESGPFALATLSNPPGTLATDLRIQGTLEDSPLNTAQQELLIIAISDSLYNVMFADDTATATLTEINPII
jgi:hypothetical protein